MASTTVITGKDGSKVTASSNPANLSTSGRYNSNGGGFVRATAPYSNGSYTKPNSTSVSKSIGDEYVRNPTRTTASSNGNVPQTPRYTGSSGGSGGGGSGEDGGYYSGGSHGTDSVLNMIKNLLNEQKAKADEYYKTLYEQQIAKNKQDWESNRNQINRNFMRGNRYLNSLYGDVSGSGLSNRARNSQNWQSNLASARQNYTNNDATALASYNSGLANNASTLAQGWYNYVLPIYTNRQQNEDDYAYRRYIANL